MLSHLIYDKGNTIAQLSQPYMTTGKTIALTIRTFVCRVMPLLFNTLTRSNHLLISWLQPPSTVILEPQKRKSVSTSAFSPSVCHAVMGLDAMILVFLIFNLKPALSLSCICMHKSMYACNKIYLFYFSVCPESILFFMSILLLHFSVD